VIYRLELQNFYSVKERQVVDLRLAENAPQIEGRFDRIYPGATERAPRVAAFFGPNASGKSTVLKALSFIRWFVVDSFQAKPGTSLPCERFNDPEGAAAPIKIAIEFPGPMEFGADRGSADIAYGTWRYEITLREQQTRTVVEGEALRQRHGTKGKWLRIFERKGSNTKVVPAFQVGRALDEAISRVRDNTSVIATLAQFAHAPSLELTEAANQIFANIFITRFSWTETGIAGFFHQNPHVLAELRKEIQRIDLGISGVGIDTSSGEPRFLFKHVGLDHPMSWQLESHGTQRFIEYFPLILAALDNGGLAVIDEIDIAIHPLILPEIVRWFHDPKRNPNRATLWVSCHAVSLLEDLEKEEIFFCEKDLNGRTSIFGLRNIKDVRRTDNRYRKYLSGVYGAIPHIG
jgi:uncharacterized protein